MTEDVTDKVFDEGFDGMGVIEVNVTAQVGKRKLLVHAAETCSGEWCSIHNPSSHPLRHAPLNWRADKSQMERICEHGVGHPDPDGLAHERRFDPEAYERLAREVHGCCGCCRVAP